MGKDCGDQGPEAKSPPPRGWVCRAVLPQPAAGVTPGPARRQGSREEGPPHPPERGPAFCGHTRSLSAGG